jgi:hypothetical protein
MRNVGPNIIYLQTAQRESEWSHPDWKFWDLWTLSIKRTHVSSIRPCALINHSLLWTLTILDGNALWLGVDSSHLCWPDCWGAWLGNWSVLTAYCRWNVPTCISMFDALTLESGWVGCVVSVFCLMFCPVSVSETLLSEAAWLSRLGPAWFCFGLISAAFGLLFAVFPVSSGLLGEFLRLFAGFILWESWMLMDYSMSIRILRWKLVSIQKFENSMWRHKAYDNVIMKFREDMF